jgi:3-oxoadipate enol-lactonase
MPVAQIDSTLAMYFEDDYYGEPWLEPEIVLLVHGVAESSRAWYGWVPHLARRHRVLRPDLRGFGRSTVPPADFEFSIAGFADDLNRFMDACNVPVAHVVAAKLGGTIAMQFAADHPERVRTLAIFSSPVQARGTGGQADLGSFSAKVERDGVRGWAAETQRSRLGSAAPQAQIDWWTDFMAETDPGVCVKVTDMAGRIDISSALPRIASPTLMATAEQSALASAEVVGRWQQQIPNSELLVMPGDSYHIAAAVPDHCARAALAFIERQSVQNDRERPGGSEKLAFPGQVE